MANYHIQIIESNRKQIRNYYTKFVLVPLRRSQEITIGNTVQKILLLSTRGTAITSVQIAELRHLFDSVNGVREDGLELILNLKQLVFRGYLSEVAYGNLLVTGPATVTASNLELPSEITIVDPDQYIATLLPGSQLDIKFTLETGKGYRSIEPNFNELLDTQFLLVDSIFSPILKVDYSLDWIDTMSEEVKKQIQDLDERTTKIVNLLQTEIKSLKEKEINNSSKVQQLEKEKYQLQSQLKAVEDNFRKADNNQSKLSYEVENLRQENSKFKSDLSVEKNNINGLEEQCFQHLENTNQLQKLSEENSKIKTFLIEIKEELKQANQEKNKLSSQVNALGENLSQLKSNLTSAQEELQKVNSDKNNLSSEINTLKNERNQLQNKTEQLESKIQDIENKLVEVTKEKEELLNLSRQTTQERLKLHEERLQLQNELNQIKRDQMALQSQFLERSNLLKEANSQLEILAQQLYPSFQLINQKLDEGLSNTFSPEIQVILSELKLQLFQTQEKLEQILLREQLSNSETQLKKITTELEKTQQLIAQTQSNFQQLQQQKLELENRLANNQGRLEQSLQQLNQSQDHQLNLRDQLSTADRRVKELEQELADLQQKIDPSKSSIDWLNPFKKK